MRQGNCPIRFYRMRCLTVGSGSPTSSSKHDWAKQMIEYKTHVGVVDNRWYNKLTFFSHLRRKYLHCTCILSKKCLQSNILINNCSILWCHGYDFSAYLTSKVRSQWNTVCHIPVLSDRSSTELHCPDCKWSWKN